VRKIDGDSMRMSLSHGKVVLLSPLGFSPTGRHSTCRWKTWPVPRPARSRPTS
jgi:hypothetical protein